MTYNELKKRLIKVETALKDLNTNKGSKHSTTFVKETTVKLNTLKESILNKLSLLKEENGTVRTDDERKAEKLTKQGVNVDLVDKIEENEDTTIEFSVNDMRNMITQVGRALTKCLKTLGDEVARIKAHRLEENSFDIHVMYKGEAGEDEFAFHIQDGNLHLADFSFNKKLVDVGVKPSGEAFINEDVLKNELMKHFKSLNEANNLKENASRNLDEIFGALGYRQGFDEFIEDNPGCVEVIMEWIGSIPEFRSKLTNEYEADELERLGFYDFDEDDFNEMIKESLNPEVSNKVNQFIKAMAKRYEYEEQDAVYAIMAALKQRKFDGLNEDLSMKIGKVVAIKKYSAAKNQKVPVDVKITDYIKKPGSKDFVEYELKGKKRKVSIDVFKSSLAENMVADKDIAKEIKKLEAENPKGFAKEISRLKARQAAIDLMKKTKNEVLKEFTDNRFKGSEVIDDANKRGPDMFGKGIFADLLPKGVASENDAVEALKAHDKSPIKARMGRYAPMFVHVQYHNLEHEGEEYQMHQTQYYNSNFKDRDPSFNPGVSKITLFKDPEGEDTNLGTIIVKTDQYVQDLRNLPGLGKRVSEAVNELDGNKSKELVKKAVADINGAMFKFRHSNPLKMIAAKDKDLKAKLDSMHNAIFDLEKVLKAKDLFEATRKDLRIGSSVSKRRAKAELKKPGNDGSKVYGLDKDGKRVHIKSINDVDKFKKFELDADLNEATGGQIEVGDYVKNQHGNIYQRVDGKVGRHDAYVRVTNGKAGKKKTGLHDSFKLTLVKKDDINESKAIITFKNDYEVKMNTGEGYDGDFEYFEAGEREQVYILDKNDKRTHVEFGDGTNAFIPSDVISVQEKSLNEFVGKELEDRNNPLYDKLVAGQGKSETVEGEILRAINRVAYRYYNDGDKYFEGYGTETAGPAHSFLVNANHPLKSAMSSIFDEPSGDSSYERMLKDALGIILDYIESKQGKYTPNNVGDIFDYEPEFEDNEDDYDDDPWGYNDEEDDDYYNEVKGNKCACKKQTKCKCSVTIKA